MISENRQQRIEERRSHLDLQINLLAEQENTKTLQLLEEIARKVGVDPAKDRMWRSSNRQPVPTSCLNRSIRRSRNLRQQIRVPEKDKYSRERGVRVSEGWKRSHAQKWAAMRCANGVTPSL
ncbi:MAG: hypothetical protein H0W66_05935 [Chthoniobacterales bacterium]|nr:hypothetical protein [Chthoniobacterales bacterium]